MKKLIGIVVCLVTILGVICGCGGSESINVSSAVAPFAGSYTGAYTQSAPVAPGASTGNLTIAVATNGQITITIVDSVSGTFVGTGIANHVGGFYITCNGANNKQVTVNGTLKGTGLGRTASGTIAGTISVGYNANFLSDPDTTIYTNHYEGTYTQGTSSDNWLGDVTSSGSFTGEMLLTAFDTSVAIKGNVYSNGSFKFTGKKGKTDYEVTGNFTLSQGTGVVCNGIVKGKTGGTTVTGPFSGHNAVGG